MSSRVRTTLALAAAVLGLLGLAATAGDVAFWRSYASALLRREVPPQAHDAGPGTTLRGGDGGGLPRAAPQEYGVDPAVLQAADEWSRQQDGDALLVLRHGHLVHEQYLRGERATPMDSGELALLLRSLATAAAIHDGALGVPAALQGWAASHAARRGDWRNPWSAAARQRFGSATQPDFLDTATGRPYAQFVAERIWAPLNASDARLSREAGSGRVRTDCCLIAQPLDWMRVAQLLLSSGRLDGETLLAPEWLARLFAAAPAAQPPPLGLQTASAARGPEPLVTAGAWFARGAGATRLWLVPRLQLAILWVATGADTGDDTTLPNLILRGTRRASGPGSGRDDQPDIGTLVPAH